MKISLFTAFAILLVSVHVVSSAENTTPGAFDMKNADVLQVLSLYRDLAGSELITDSRVKTVRHQITLAGSASGKEAAAKLVEGALLEQAGVVITHLDARRVSVTYNDALPISGAKKSPGNK